MTEHLYPSEAGFNGHDGFRLPMQGRPDWRIYLKRGPRRPSECPDTDWREQLLWWEPKGELPHLLWCNSDGQWFDLTFTPIEEP